MLMEGRVKFLSPQNIARVSQIRGIVVTSHLIKVNGDHVSTL